MGRTGCDGSLTRPGKQMGTRHRATASIFGREIR
jgi:hypothetical protein